MACVQPEASCADPIALACTQLDGIMNFMKSSASSSAKQSLVSDIGKLHKRIRLSNYKKETTKHKIRPNSSSRKLTEKAKKRKLQSEHGYSTDKARPNRQFTNLHLVENGNHRLLYFSEM